MRGEDFTTALQTLGLDTQAAAKWLGVSVRAVQRYRVSGAPGPVAGMVRLALRMDEYNKGLDESLYSERLDYPLEWKE